MTTPCRFIIKKGNADYYCMLCDCHFYGDYDVDNHVNGRRHRDARSDFACDIKESGYNNYYCRLCDCKIPGYENVYNHVTGRRHQSFRHDNDDDDYGDDDDHDDKYEESDERDSSGRASPYFICDFICDEGHEKYHCVICGCDFFGYKNYIGHVNGRKHLVAIEKYGTDIKPCDDDDLYYCNRCDCYFRDYNNIYDHIMGRRHQSSLHGDELEKKKEWPKSDFTCPFIWREDSDHYYCIVCGYDISGYSSFRYHVDGSRHDTVVNRYGCDIFPLSYDDYYCSCCDCTILYYRNVYHHLKGQRHQDLLRDRDEAEKREAEKLKNQKRAAEKLQREKEEVEKAVGRQVLREMTEEFEVKKKETEKRRKEDEFDQRWIAEMLKLEKEAERRKVEKEQTEKWEAEKREAEKWKVEKEDAERWKAEKEEAERRNSDKEKAEKLVAEGRKAERDKDEKGKVKNEKGAENKVSMQQIRENLDKIIAAELENFSISSKNEKIRVPEESINLSKTISANAKSPNLDNATIDNPAITSENSRLAPLEKTSCSKSKQAFSSLPKPSIQKCPNLQFNFGKDIYDMKDKVREIQLGMELSLVNDSNNIYCLICRKTVANTTINYFEHLCDLDHCEYLEGMEKDHALFEIVPGQFSDLHLAYEYIEEDSEDAIKCLVCKKDLGNDNDNLERHINEETHKKISEKMRLRAKKNFEIVTSRMQCDWYKVERYCCIPCSEDFNSEIDFLKHLESKKHANFLKKSENQERGLIFDFCAPCALLWYGYRSTYAYHCNTSSHKWYVKNGNSLAPELPETAKRLLMESEKYVNDTIKYLNLVEAKERERNNRLIEDLHNSIKWKLEGFKAHAFGPRESGLGSPDSKLCIFLDCEDMYGEKISSEDQILHFVESVHKALSDNLQIWTTEKITTSFRNFTIKSHHNKTGLSCEISFKNGLAVKNTKLIKSFIDKCSSCRKLILFLNRWLTFCNVSGSEPISSYALEWWVIFYLQKKSLLPSIAILMEKENSSRTISGWEVGVSDDFTCNEAATSITDLLIGFFTFYANFDYRHDVACPVLGDILKKRAFADTKTLPNEMAPYIAFMENRNESELLPIDSVMCIQDPFDLGNNLTRAIGKADLSRFRTFCSKSLEVLRSSEIPP